MTSSQRIYVENYACSLMWNAFYWSSWFGVLFPNLSKEKYILRSVTGQVFLILEHFIKNNIVNKFYFKFENNTLNTLNC